MVVSHKTDTAARLMKIPEKKNRNANADVRTVTGELFTNGQEPDGEGSGRHQG